VSLPTRIGSVRYIAVYVRHDVVTVVDTYHRVEPMLTPAETDQFVALLTEAGAKARANAKEKR